MKRSLIAVTAATALFAATAAAQTEAERGRGLREPELRSAPSPAVAAPQRAIPRTVQQREIAAIQEAGREKVQSLIAAMEGLSDGPALLALQRKVEETKRETRIAALRLHAVHARARGDLATAAEAERLIEAILKPAKPAVAPVTRPAPGAEGGIR